MGRERIQYDVPEGFLPQNEPVDPAKRYQREDILLSTATVADLPDIANAIQTSFPEIWWANHQPPNLREKDPAERLRRCAERCRVFVDIPGTHSIKASDAKTGKFMGFACWYSPGMPIHCLFHRDTIDFYKVQEKWGWSDEHVADIWSTIDLKSWENEFETYDVARKKEMGDTPHWYLGPFFVLEEFRGRGVGSLLMRYGTELAEASNPPLACFLEALPNARPVYYRYGFEGLEDRGKGFEPAMIRYPKGEKAENAQPYESIVKA